LIDYEKQTKLLEVCTVTVFTSRIVDTDLKSRFGNF